MKHCGRWHRPRKTCVAPHAGAWIETVAANPYDEPLRSPPTRGRGLKQITTTLAVVLMGSPPTRGRGLKL